MKRFVLALAMLPVVGVAHEFKSGDLTISHPWTRAMPAGAGMAAGYLSITNTGREADILQAVEVNGAEAMLHETKLANGVAAMEHVEGGIAIAPGKTVVLKPGSLHLMWDQPAPLKEGEMVEGRLVFRKAQAVKVEFKVEPAGMREAGHAH